MNTIGTITDQNSPHASFDLTEFYLSWKHVGIRAKIFLVHQATIARLALYLVGCMLFVFEKKAGVLESSPDGIHDRVDSYHSLGDSCKLF